MAGIGGDRRRTFRDFVTLEVQGISSTIAWLTIEVKNVGLKSALILMVQQPQFRYNPLDDPNLHLSAFLEEHDTLKINKVSTDAICLRLIPFSLSDKARAWQHSLPPGCIMTMDELISCQVPSSE